jgi:hypothetical protein
MMSEPLHRGWQQFCQQRRNQPTCTIQALAYRAADHIASMAKNGNVPTAL